MVKSSTLKLSIIFDVHLGDKYITDFTYETKVFLFDISEHIWETKFIEKLSLNQEVWQNL